MPALNQRIGEVEDAALLEIAGMEDRIYKVVVPKRQIKQEEKKEPPAPKVSPNRRKRGNPDAAADAASAWRHPGSAHPQRRESRERVYLSTDRDLL